VAYEGTAFNSLMETTRWIPVYGPKVPPNAQKQFDNIVKMVEDKIIPMEVAWDMLRKIGYELPDNNTLMEQTVAQAQTVAAVEADAMASRINGEIQATQELQGAQ
jgi:hypothetical protein